MVLFTALLVALSLITGSNSAPPMDSNPVIYDLENYDVETDPWEHNNYAEGYDYDDVDEEIEVGTIAPPPLPSPEPPAVIHVEEVPLALLPTKAPTPPTLDFTGTGLFGPDSGLGMPTCLLCVCISGSVYCDDAELDQIPPLPKDTTHFYARFNSIKRLQTKDFVHLNQLKRIDLTGNQISAIEEDALRSLSQLQELLLADNRIQTLPELPKTIKHLDVSNNQLKSARLHDEAFKDMSNLQFLYLSKNQLDYVPVPLPESLRVLHLQNNNIQTLHEDTFCNHHNTRYVRPALEDIRLDGNPLNINLFPRAYVCLPRLPVGNAN
ncbi:opticin [Clupea harengus]|uniref:Opticin n=1 Tax=Clupea harengus TaxID=7950 RepID=A0A6P8FH26_CLUHA|nr:opticin [Clupea harengus]